MEGNHEEKEAPARNPVPWRTLAPLKLWDRVRNGEFSDQEMDELGETALRELNYDAAEVFLAASGLRKKDFSFVLRLARRYESVGDYKRAVKILQYGVEQQVPTPEIFLLLGKFQERRKDFDRALETYRRAQTLFPDLAEDPEFTDAVERAKRRADLKGRVQTRGPVETDKAEPGQPRPRTSSAIPVQSGDELKATGSQAGPEKVLRKWLESLKKQDLKSYLECYSPETRLHKEATFDDIRCLYGIVRDFEMSSVGVDGGLVRATWLAADLCIPKWIFLQPEGEVWFISFMEHLSEGDSAGL